MTAFTSKADGNWSASGTTTWTQAGVPGTGDSVTISHNITVDVNTTVGTSGVATTIDILVSAGSLTVAPGVVFTARGSATIGNIALTLGAGSSYLFDSSLASGTPVYKINYGTAGSQQNSKIIANGTAGAHVTIGKASGSGNGIIQPVNNSGSTWAACNFQYTDFADLGTSTPAFGTDAVVMQLNHTARAEAVFQHCTMARCGRFTTLAVTAANDLVWQFNRITAPLANAGTSFFTTAPTTGLRNITDSTWPCELYGGATTLCFAVFSGTLGGIVFERCTTGAILSFSTDTLPFASFKDILTIQRSASSGAPCYTEIGHNGDTLKNCYLVVDAAAGTGDAYGIVTTNLSFTGPVTMDGVVWDVTIPDEDGDFGHHGAPSSGAVAITWKNCLSIPNSRGLSSGSINSHGSRHVSIQFSHNTLMTCENISPTTTGLVAIGVGSGYCGYVGMYPLLQNNLVWSPTPRAGSSGDWISNNLNSGGPWTGTADVGSTTVTLVDAAPSSAFPGGTVLADGPARLYITAKRGAGPNVGEFADITSQVGSTLTWGAGQAMSAPPDTGTDYIMFVPDLITASGEGSNGLWNVSNGTITDQNGQNATTKLGYNGFWQTNPTTFGATDFSLPAGTSGDPVGSGPMYIDPTRNFARFDTAYLGNTETPWVTGHGYVVGDRVSSQIAGFYNNAVINYRCVVSNTSGATTQPGTGTSWRTDWELASAYRMREAILAGTTITDPSLGLVNANYVNALSAWVKNGFSPRSPLLIGKATDGGTIGGVPGTPQSSGRGLRIGMGRILVRR